MKLLKYKGLIFDDYAQNEDGTYWAEICEKCVKKYWEKIKDDIDDGGTARGYCSVQGCCNDGNDEMILHYYIDFKTEHVSFEEVSDDELYDEQYI